MVFVLLGCFYFVPSARAAANTWQSTGSTSWNTAGNWSLARVPNNTDTATFDATSTVSCNIDATANVAGLAMNSGYSGTVTLQAGITIGAAGFVQAAGTFNGSNQTMDLNSAFSLSTAGTSFTAPSGGMTVTGGWTHTDSSSFSHNNGTITWDNTNATGVTQAFNVNTTETFYNFIVNPVSGNSAISVAAGDSLAVTNMLTVTNGQFLGTGKFDAQKDVTYNSTFDGGTGVLDISGSATRTINFPSGGSFPVLNINAANVTVDMTGSSSTTFPRNFTVAAGTFNQQSAPLVFTGSGFNISGGTFNGNSAAIDTDGVVTITAGTFKSTSGNLNVNNSWTHTAGGTWNNNSGTVIFDSALGRTWNFDSGIGGNSGLFNNFTLQATSTYILTISAGDSLITNGTLTLTDGGVDGGTLLANGHVTIGSGYDGGTAPLVFDGSNAQTFDLTGATAVFNADITVNKDSNTVSLASALVMDAANQDLRIQASVFDISGYALTVNGTSGTLIVNSGGILQLKGGETITANVNYPQLDSGSGVAYDGDAGPYTIKDYPYYNLKINSMGNQFNLGVDTTIGGSLTLQGGIFYLNGRNLVVSGTFSNNSVLRLKGTESLTGTLDTDSGNVEFVGDGDAAADTYTITSFAATYYGLNINSADGATDTFQLGAALDCNGDLSISSGTFDVSTGNRQINVGNSFQNNGTFNARSGQVVLDGTNQNLSGTITFYDLTKNVTSAATLTFPASTTVTVTHNLNLQGNSTSNRLSLRSSVDTTQFNISPTGMRMARYLDVKDSNNTSGVTIDCDLGCYNSTNNTAWNFNQRPVINTETVAYSSGGADISAVDLVENSTKRIYVHGSATDYDGCTEINDVSRFSIKIFRADLGDLCSGDNNNCYTIAGGSTTVSGCTGGGDYDLNYEGYVDLQYYADPTDSGTYSAANWSAKVQVTDSPGLPNINFDNFEMNSLIAFNVTASVDYGTIALGADSTQQTITFTNTGNRRLDADQTASGDMACSGEGSVNVPVGNAHLSLNDGFTYGVSDQALTITATNFDLDIEARTNDASPLTKNAYLILRLPSLGVRGSCTNTITYTAKLQS